MSCTRKCTERKNVRVTLGCPHTTPHPQHDWYSRRSGRHVHCYGVSQEK